MLGLTRSLLTMDSSSRRSGRRQSLAPHRPAALTSAAYLWVSQRTASKQLSPPSGVPAEPPLVAGSGLYQV